MALTGTSRAALVAGTVSRLSAALSGVSVSAGRLLPVQVGQLPVAVVYAQDASLQWIGHCVTPRYDQTTQLVVQYGVTAADDAALDAAVSAAIDAVMDALVGDETWSESLIERVDAVSQQVSYQAVDSTVPNALITLTLSCVYTVQYG